MSLVDIWRRRQASKTHFIVFTNCHPEEDFSPTKDLRFSDVEMVIPTQTNLRSFDCGARLLRASAQDDNLVVTIDECVETR